MNGIRAASEPILTGTLGQTDQQRLFCSQSWVVLIIHFHLFYANCLLQSFYCVPWNIFPMVNTIPHTFKLFSSHNILKSHPFFPWLKSASPPRLPGKIQFILHISVQTILPVRHYFPDNSQSPPMRSLSYMFICHYLFIISPLHL